MINADKIVEMAHALTGLPHFEGSSGYVRLGEFVEVANRYGRLSESSEGLIEGGLINSLMVRLQIESYVHTHPELAAQRIERPVFVLGMQRSGTTLVHRLLAADPGRRYLMNWEAAHPAPPAAPGGQHADPRCTLKRRLQEIELKYRPSRAVLHWEYADEPTECGAALAYDFTGWSVHPLFRDPAHIDAALALDMTSSYRFHKTILQILQSNNPGAWILKWPTHAVYVSALLAVYPDARLIWTHRDPYRVVASALSLAEMFARACLDSDCVTELGVLSQHVPRMLSEYVRRLMRVHQEHGNNRLYDLHYARLLRNPLQEMERLYKWLGEDFSSQARERVTQWLQTNPQGLHGRHDYSLGRFGRSVEDLQPLFEEYRKSYDVELER